MLIEMTIKFHLAIYMELLETVYLLIKKLKVRILKMESENNKNIFLNFKKSFR